MVHYGGDSGDEDIYRKGKTNKHKHKHKQTNKQTQKNETNINTRYPFISFTIH